VQSNGGAGPDGTNGGMFNRGNVSAGVNGNASAGMNQNQNSAGLNAQNPNGTIGGAVNVNPGTGANFPNFPLTTPDGRDPYVTNNATPGATPVNPVGPGNNAAFNTGVNTNLLTGATPPVNSNLNPNTLNSAASGVGLANQSNANIQAGFNQSLANAQNNGNVQNNSSLNGNGAYNPNTRMQFYNNAWWYLQPNSQWMLYRNNTWIPYTAQPNGAPSATVPTTSGPAPAASPAATNPTANPPAAPAPVSGTPSATTTVDSSGVISGP
jgi:hypothetical protein